MKALIDWLTWWTWRRWRIYCPAYRVWPLFAETNLADDIYGHHWSPCSLHPNDKAPIQFCSLPDID